MRYILLLCSLLLAAPASAQFSYRDLPSSAKGLSDMRVSLTGDFAKLQAGLRSSDAAVRRQAEADLALLVRKVYVLRGHGAPVERTRYEEGEAQQSYPGMPAYRRQIPAHGVLGYFSSRYGQRYGSTREMPPRLVGVCEELKELPLPIGPTFGPAELNQIQRVLDKMHEALSMDKLVK